MFNKCKHSYWKQIETHFSHDICVLWPFQVILVVKNLLANAGDVKDTGSNPRLGRHSWRRAWQATPGFMPGESHGHWSLVGDSPWGHKELDMAELI